MTLVLSSGWNRRPPPPRADQAWTRAARSIAGRQRLAALEVGKRIFIEEHWREIRFNMW